MLNVIQLPQLSDNYGYLIYCSETKQAAVIDSPKAKPILDSLKKMNLKLIAIFNTHHHWDHVGANEELIQCFPELKVYAHESDKHRIPGITNLLNENDEVTLGNCKAKVLFNPGHTTGHISYHFYKDQKLFCGDTLFGAGCGRLFEGTPEQMNHSLNEVIGSLPKETLAYCAHEYTLNNLEFCLTVEPNNQKLIERHQKVTELRKKDIPSVPFSLEEELATNVFLRLDSQEVQDYVKKEGVSKLTPSSEIFAKLRANKDCF